MNEDQVERLISVLEDIGTQGKQIAGQLESIEARLRKIEDSIDCIG